MEDYERAVTQWHDECVYLWQKCCYDIAVRHRKIQLILALSSLEPKHRSCHKRPIIVNKRTEGVHHNLVAEMRLNDHQSFFNFHRMSPNKFDELLGIVGPLIVKITLFRTDVITPAERLSITLRYLASGDSMISLKYAYRVSVSSISNIIKETTKILWTELKNIVFPVPTEELWLSISKKFFERWNYPNCIGAIDGKHVVTQAPNKGTHSLALYAVCDADYCLTLVDIGAAGRQSNGGVFKNSLYGQALQEKKLCIPAPKEIPRSRRITPHLFVADAAFPMTDYMMRPYPQRGLSDEKRIFNYRLSRARRVIENVFGIMADRWRLLRMPIIGKLENIEGIIQAICVLHNFLQSESMQQHAGERLYCPPSLVDREVDGVLVAGEWRGQVGEIQGLLPARNLGTHTHARVAEQIRRNLTEYFMNEGAVPWQQKQAGLE